MSEYWVSRKKYFCKYCDIYIADDAPSRRQHENGLRHQGNRDRFVRSLYKEGERMKKDAAEEKREMVRVELAANVAFAKDVHSGLASASASTSRNAPAPPSRAAAPTPVKLTSKWSNYSTAQSLGFVDPDEAKRQAELERKQSQGVAGAWEVVAPPPPPLSVSISNADKSDVKDEEGADSQNPSGSQSSSQKREADEDPEDGRGFKIRKRTAHVGLGEIWDPGDIPIKTKRKAATSTKKMDDRKSTLKEENNSAPMPTASSSLVKHEPSNGSLTETAAPGRLGGWKRATAPVDSSSEVYFDPVAEGNSNEVPTIHRPLSSSGRVTPENGPQGPNLPMKAEPSTIKEEFIEGLYVNVIPETTSGSMFRKRKLPAGGRSSVRR